MKKYISLACLLCFVLVFSSCFKDTCRHTYTLRTPVYAKLAALRAAVQSSGPAPVVNTGKLYINGAFIFLNEQGKGIHVIDNSNPARPVKTAFINIPGNVDIAIKNNILYADLYSDLAAINILDPKHITVAKFLTNTFPSNMATVNTNNPDSINILTGWASHDTTVDCENNNINYPIYYNAAPSTALQSNTGGSAAGSMARFAAVDNYMYTVSSSNLGVIDISQPASPFLVETKPIGADIETIFPYHSKLYIGAGNSMSVFDLQNPANPQQLSWSGHWCSSDPVVADESYAYVTLHDANVCRQTVNELEIYQLTAGNEPVLVKTYPLNHPQGLSKDGNLLFICDDGLKIYDISDVRNIQLIKHVSGIDGYDVIAADNIAYLVGKDGLYQYNYRNSKDIYLLSKLSK